MTNTTTTPDDAERDADPAAPSAGQGVAAADAQQSDDDGATPEAMLNEEFELGDNGADKEQRTPDEPAPPPGVTGLMTILANPSSTPIIVLGSRSQMKVPQVNVEADPATWIIQARKPAAQATPQTPPTIRKLFRCL